MTAEEQLKELCKERNITIITESNGTVSIHGQGSVCIFPGDIDLIANLVVERLTTKLDRILKGVTWMVGEEIVDD